ncbi:MAG: hypothetical protein ACXWCG_08305 [Flavitalea sp.]
MDEYNSGMDPEVKMYFRKIMRSFSVGLLWLLVVATAGIYFKLGEVRYSAHWYNYLFYFLSLLSFIFLIRFYYKLWKKP